MEKNNGMFSQALISSIEDIFKRLIDSYLLPKIKEQYNETEYYTNKQMKEKFGLTTANMYYYRKEGMISYTQMGRKIIYSKEAVHEFLTEHTIKREKQV